MGAVLSTTRMKRGLTKTCLYTGAGRMEPFGRAFRYLRAAADG